MRPAHGEVELVDGDVLRLALAGGGRVEFVNSPDFCDDAADCDVYSFFGYDDALAAGACPGL